jgi:4-hydroxybenzoate polyprenyltransferase
MYLNDSFDREWDRLHRPERPIARGLISARAVFVSGFGLLAFGLAQLVLASVGPLAFGSALALALLIVLYNVVHKKTALSPLIMGLCRVAVYATAAFSVSSALDGKLAFGTALLLCHLIGFSYVAKHETKTSLRRYWPLLFLELPVVGTAYLFTTDAPFGIAGAPLPGLVALPLIVLFFGWGVYALSFLPGFRKEPNIGRTVVFLIAAISILDGLLLLRFAGTLPALVGLGCFALTLILQRWVAGT